MWKIETNGYLGHGRPTTNSWKKVEGDKKEKNSENLNGALIKIIITTNNSIILLFWNMILGVVEDHARSKTEIGKRS